MNYDRDSASGGVTSTIANVLVSLASFSSSVVRV
jgi:hypothetical protein